MKSVILLPFILCQAIAMPGGESHWRVGHWKGEWNEQFPCPSSSELPLPTTQSFLPPPPTTGTPTTSSATSSTEPPTSTSTTETTSSTLTESSTPSTSSTSISTTSSTSSTTSTTAPSPTPTPTSTTTSTSSSTSTSSGLAPCPTCNPKRGENKCDISTSCGPFGGSHYCVCPGGLKGPSDVSYRIRDDDDPAHQYYVFVPEGTACLTACDRYDGQLPIDVCSEVPLADSKCSL